MACLVKDLRGEGINVMFGFKKVSFKLFGSMTQNADEDVVWWCMDVRAGGAFCFIWWGKDGRCQVREGEM